MIAYVEAKAQGHLERTHHFLCCVLGSLRRGMLLAIVAI